MAVPEKKLSGDLANPAVLAAALEQIERGPETIAAAISGASPRALRFKPSPQKWCALEILAHLADVELVYGFRLRQIVAQPGSTITPIDQDAWAARLSYMEAEPAVLLERLRVNRRANISLLRKLNAADLGKSAFHPEYQGDFTLADLLAFMRAHDPNHLKQIQRLLEQAAAAGA